MSKKHAFTYFAGPTLALVFWLPSTVIAQVRTLVVVHCGNNKDVTLFIRRAYSTKTKLNENTVVFDGK